MSSVKRRPRTPRGASPRTPPPSVRLLLRLAASRRSAASSSLSCALFSARNRDRGSWAAERRSGAPYAGKLVRVAPIGASGSLPAPSCVRSVCTTDGSRTDASRATFILFLLVVFYFTFSRLLFSMFWWCCNAARFCSRCGKNWRTGVSGTRV